jgi:hypothetical protein
MKISIQKDHCSEAVLVRQIQYSYHYKTSETLKYTYKLQIQQTNFECINFEHN